MAWLKVFSFKTWFRRPRTNRDLGWTAEAGEGKRGYRGHAQTLFREFVKYGPGGKRRGSTYSGQAAHGKGTQRDGRRDENLRELFVEHSGKKRWLWETIHFIGLLGCAHAHAQDQGHFEILHWRKWAPYVSSSHHAYRLNKLLLKEKEDKQVCYNILTCLWIATFKGEARKFFEDRQYEFIENVIKVLQLHGNEKIVRIILYIFKVNRLTHQ